MKYGIRREQETIFQLVGTILRKLGQVLLHQSRGKLVFNSMRNVYVYDVWY